MTPELAKIIHLSKENRELKKKVKLMQAALDSCYAKSEECFDLSGRNVTLNRKYFDEEKVVKARGSEITWYLVKPT